MKKSKLAILVVMSMAVISIPKLSEAVYGNVVPDPGQAHGRWVAHELGNITRINTEDSYNPSQGVNNGINGGLYNWSGTPLLNDRSNNPGIIKVYDLNAVLYGEATIFMRNSATDGGPVSLSSVWNGKTREIADISVGNLTNKGDENITVSLSWSSVTAVVEYLVYYSNTPCGDISDPCAGFNSNGEYHLRGSTGTNSATITIPHPSKMQSVSDYDAWFLVIPVFSDGRWGVHSLESAKTNISNTIPSPTPTKTPTKTWTASKTPTPTPTMTPTTTPTFTSTFIPTCLASDPFEFNDYLVRSPHQEINVTGKAQRHFLCSPFDMDTVWFYTKKSHVYQCRVVEVAYFQDIDTRFSMYDLNGGNIFDAWGSERRYYSDFNGAVYLLVYDDSPHRWSPDYGVDYNIIIVEWTPTKTPTASNTPTTTPTPTNIPTFPQVGYFEDFENIGLEGWYIDESYIGRIQPVPKSRSCISRFKE